MTSELEFDDNSCEKELYSKSMCRFERKINKTGDDKRTSQNFSKSKKPKVVSFKRRTLGSHLKKIEEKYRAERARNDRLQKYLKRLLAQKSELLTQLKLSQEKREKLKIEFSVYREYISKEIRRLHHELDATSKEYYQVMSERDAMNKDMQALEEKILKIEDINSQIIQSQSQNSSCTFLEEKLCVFFS